MQNRYNNLMVKDMKYIKFAFTLAEVLIVLGVVGIVAAVTIPTLIKNTQDAEFKSAWKKEFSVISQAFSMIKNDNGGSFQSLCTGNYTNAGNNCLLTTFSDYLKFTKTCNAPSYQGCWHSNNAFYWLNNSPALSSHFLANQGAGAILNDGTLMYFINSSSTCETSTYGISTCGGIMVDVNGFKPPNTVGRDIFGMHILSDKIVPFGVAGDTYATTILVNCISTGPGGGCSAKYLYDQ